MKQVVSFGGALLCTACVAVLGSLVPSSALANPEGGRVVSGVAGLTSHDKQLRIHQISDKAIIDWKSFDIGVDEKTRFYQPSSSSTVLNRVVGTKAPSEILGNLEANGHVFLVNPHGVVFGKNAQVDVQGLVATTSDIRNQDFMQGKLEFTKPGKADAAIVNYV